MLALLRHRCQAAGDRLSTEQGDARRIRVSSAPDLIVSHFFLDCLTQQEVSTLVRRLRPHLQPGALWLVSDFRVPDGVIHWPVHAGIRLLYFVFRLLTGLRVKRLPDHAAALTACGFSLREEHRLLAGILTTQLWSLSGSEDPSDSSR